MGKGDCPLFPKGEKMKKIGKQTYKIDGDVSILSTACIAGPKEKAGPLSKFFDQTVKIDK